MEKKKGFPFKLGPDFELKFWIEKELVEDIAKEFDNCWNLGTKENKSFLANSIFNSIYFSYLCSAELTQISKSKIRKELRALIKLSAKLHDLLDKTSLATRAFIGCLFMGEDPNLSKIDVLEDKVSEENLNVIKLYDKIWSGEDFHTNLALLGSSSYTRTFPNLQLHLIILLTKAAQKVLDVFASKSDGRPPVAKPRTLLIRDLSEAFDILIYKYYKNRISRAGPWNKVCENHRRNKGGDLAAQLGAERIRFVGYILDRLKIRYRDNKEIVTILGNYCNPEPSYLAFVKRANEIYQEMMDPRNDPVKNPCLRIIEP